MDFKSLISKLSSMDDQIPAVAAPVLPKAIQLNEDAALRVLAGQSTYVAEAKKKADLEKKKTDKKVDEAATVKYDADGKRTGVVNKDTRQYSDEPHSEPASKAKSQSAAEKAAEKAADKKQDKDSKAYEKEHGKGSVTRVKDGKKVESIEPQFKSKFMKMVEAKKDEADKKKADKKKKVEEGSKPDFLDLDGDGDKKEPMKKAASEKGEDKKDSDAKGLSAKQKKLPPGLQKAIAAKSESKIMPKGKKRAVAEDLDKNGIRDDLINEITMILDGALGGTNQTDHIIDDLGEYFDDIESSGDNVAMAAYEMMNDVIDQDTKLQIRAARKALKMLKQGMAEDGLQKAIAAKSESKVMPKGKKRAVAESVEQKLNFRDMIKLVQESGGQQQIDPLDKSLFNWATRVAASKLGEGTKAELYAGLIYERNGGVFEMYDVLSEAQK